MESVKLCLGCNKELINRRSNATYCTARCRSLTLTRQYNGATSARKDISPSTVGAIHELIVCTDLMDRGYAVFRAVSPTCVCDIMILANNKAYRVEVTTGRYRATKELVYPEKDFDKFDILAVVYQKEITYYPPFEEQTL